MSASDEQLMARCRAGDNAALGVLYQRYRDKACRLAYRYLGDWGAAEDLCQETFLRVMRSREQYDDRFRFQAWLYRIATNLCLNELRRRRGQHCVSIHDTLTIALDDVSEETVELSELLIDDSQVPVADQVERQELIQLAQSAVTELSDAQRTALRLRLDQGLSYAEIATRTDCSVGTAKSRVHYALERVRWLLEEPSPAPQSPP